MARPRALIRWGGGLLLALAGTAARARTQYIAPRPEVRVDLLGAAPYTAQLGAGVNLGAGYYQRVELDVAGGALRRGGALEGTARADALMRLLLDPFGQQRWGLSLAGGVSVRYEAGDRVRPYLTGALDFEGPVSHGVRMAYQLGFGGGVRVGVVFRRTSSVWR
ncbi:MAG TPA: hypothetical protein VF737_04200 [Gemmatimonadaceae bacterium]